MNAQVKTDIENFYQANKAGVDSLAQYLGVPPLWLVALFQLESSLNPAATNSIGAVGLNQMMPSTLAQFGVTPQQYIDGGVDFQLQIMRGYFLPVKGIVKRAGDLYLYNLYPEAVVKNWSMDTAIGRAGDTTTRHGISLDKIYQENKGLDYNKDGVLTRGDVEQLFESRYDELVTGDFFFRDLWIDLKTNLWVWIAIATLVLITIAVIIYAK